MSLLWHQIRKDVRYLRWALLMWVALVFTGATFTGTASGLGGALGSIVYNVVSNILPTLQALMLVVLVPLLVQGEALVGTTAAWLTRPLSRTTLLAGKVVLAAAAFLVLPLLAELLVLALHGVQPRDMLLAGAEILFLQTAWILGVAVLAVLTPSLARFIVWVAGVFIAWTLVALAISLVSLWKVRDDPSRMAELSITQTQEVFAAAATIFVGAVVVVHQYLTRRTRRSAMMAVAGGVVVLAVQALLPRPSAADGTIPPTAPIQVTVAPEEVWSHDAVSLSPTRAPKTDVSAPIACAGAPAASYCLVEDVRGSLRYPDGRELAVQGKSRSMAFGHLVKKDALAAALGVPTIHGGRFHSLEPTSELFQLDRDVYLERRRMPATLRARGTLRVREYRLAAELPLQEGARHDHGSQHLVISDVRKGPGRCEVELAKSDVSLLFGPGGKRAPVMAFVGDSEMFVLLNRARGEAVLPSGGFADVAAMFDLMSTQRLVRKVVPLAFFQESEATSFPDLTEAWLSEASLARVTTTDVVRLPGTSFEVDGLVLDRDHFRAKSATVLDPAIEKGLTPAEYEERGHELMESVMARPPISWNPVTRARAYFEKALEGEPRSVPAHVGMALVAASLEQDPKKKRRTAAPWLEKARAIAREHPSYFRVEAWLGEAEGGTGDPVAEMRKALAQASGVAVYHRDLAHFLARRYQMSQALAAFRKAQALSKSSREQALVHVRTAEAFDHVDDPDAAVDSYERALTLRDDDPLSWTRLCQIAVRVKRHGQAENAAKKALALEKTTIARSCLLRAQLGTGRFREEDWPPDQIWTGDLLAIGDHYRDRGEAAKADAWYAKARSSSADASALAISVSEAALRRGRADEAWSLVEAPLARRPDDPDLLLQAAAVHWAKGLHREARDLGARALEARRTRETEERLARIFGDDRAFRDRRAEVEARIDALFGYYARTYDHQRLRRDLSMAEWVIGNLGARHKDAGALPPLVRYLEESPFSSLRAAAADALWHIGDRRAVPALIAALGDSSPRVRGFAASGLGDLGDPAAVDPLLRLFATLPDNREETKARVADALGKLGDARAVEPLRVSLETLREPAYVRWAAPALARLEKR